MIILKNIINKIVLAAASNLPGWSIIIPTIQGPAGPPGSAQTRSVKTSDFSLSDLNANTIFANDGASGLVTATIDPSAITAGKSFSFRVTNANGIKIQAASGKYIRVGGDITASGGYIRSITVGATLTIEVENSTDIYVTSMTGNWPYE